MQATHLCGSVFMVALFTACGEVQRVRLLDPVGDDGRGFVDFGNLTASAAAITKHGEAQESMEGRHISVSYSRKAVSSPASGRRSQEARSRRRAKRDALRGGTGESVLNLGE